MRFSRHARNNMRLYKIPESDILDTLKSPDVTENEGNKTIAVKQFRNKFSDYPLKVVYRKVEKEVFVITAYPLKRKTWE